METTIEQNPIRQSRPVRFGLPLSSYSLFSFLYDSCLISIVCEKRLFLSLDIVQQVQVAVTTIVYIPMELGPFLNL